MVPLGYKAAAAKSAGAAGLPGTGWGLGLGLGLGIWGPLTLVGLGVAGGYYYWAKYRTMHD